MRWSSCRGLGLLPTIRRRARPGRGSAGQVQEHVVQRGAAQAEIFDCDPFRLQYGRDVLDHREAVTRRDGDLQVRTDAVGRGGGQPDGAERPRRPLAVGGVQQQHLDRGLTCAILELVACSVSDDPAPVDHDDTVGQLIGLFEVLGREQQCGALRGELTDHLPHADAGAWIQPRGRLVEKQQPWRHDQAGSQIQAATHTAGVLPRRPVGGVGQIEALQQRIGTAAGVVRCEVEQLGEHHQVLPAAEQLVDSRVLPRQGDLLAHDVRGRDHIGPEDLNGAPGRAQQRREDPHQRGLARAVGPQQTNDLARPHREIHASQRMDRTELLVDTTHIDREPVGS